jgi:hypothetical protein
VLEKEQQPMTVARAGATVHGHAAGLMYGTRVDAEKRPEAVGLLAAAAAAPQRGTRATASVFSHDWQPGLSGWKDVTDARLQAMQAPSSTVSAQGQSTVGTLSGPRSATEARLMGARDPSAMVQWHQGKEAPALVVRPHVEGPGTAGRDPHMAIMHRQTHGQRPALIAGTELQVDAAQTPLTWRPDLALPLHRPENMHLARESRKVHANQDLTTASGGVADVGSAGRMATQSTRMVGQVIASHRTALPDRAVGNKAFTRMTPVSTRMRTDQDVAVRASPSPRRPGQRPGARTVAANNKY